MAKIRVKSTVKSYKLSTRFLPYEFVARITGHPVERLKHWLEINNWGTRNETCSIHQALSFADRHRQSAEVLNRKSSAWRPFVSPVTYAKMIHWIDANKDTWHGQMRIRQGSKKRGSLSRHYKVVGQSNFIRLSAYCVFDLAYRTDLLDMTRPVVRSKLKQLHVFQMCNMLKAQAALIAYACECAPSDVLDWAINIFIENADSFKSRTEGQILPLY